MSIRILIPAAVVILAASAVACQKSAEKDLAPAAQELEPAKAKTAAAKKAQISSSESEVTLAMEAPLEKIYGVAKEATSGELFIDLSDISKTSGIIKVNLQKLVLTQEKRESEDQAFGERTKEDTQNEHARTWMEISDDTPEAERKKNEIVQFKIKEVKDVSENDVTKLEGDQREITATVTGDFVLHQRQVEKTVKMKIVFDFSKDDAKAVHMTTVEPLVVDLEEHDVRPRKAFGVLAEKTLSAVGKKVDKTPEISLDLKAQLVNES